MLSSHLKKILPNLSIISPLRQSCQHNRQDRITGFSLSSKGRHEKEGLIASLSLFFFFSISLFPSITTSPSSLHTKLTGWKERNGREKEMVGRGGRGGLKDIMHMKMS